MEASTTDKVSNISQLSQIIVFNLVPVYGVLFLKWDARQVILAYFMETIIALLFHAVRLWYVHFRFGNMPETLENTRKLEAAGNTTPMNPVFVPLFMLAVFGFFCFVQLLILGGFADKVFPDGIFSAMYQLAKGELAWVMVTYTLLQLIRFSKEIITRQYAGVPPIELFFQPFRRILVQQLTVILGGFFILFGGAHQYVIVLVLVSLIADLFIFFIGNSQLKAIMTKDDPERKKAYEEMERAMKN